MDVADVILQGLGWVSVVWLVTVNVLVGHGRLAGDGLAFRAAGCAAALSIVAASVAERIWPVAVLGLLWLRIEVFGHRHQSRSAPAETEVAPERMPAFLASSLSRDEPHPQMAHRSGPAHPHLPHPHLPHPHVPHPHLGPRAVDRVFKIEMAIVVLIALVFFVFWAEQQRDTFTSTTDNVVCSWIDGCP